MPCLYIFLLCIQGEQFSNESLEGTTDKSTDTVTNQMNDTSNNNQSQTMSAAAPSLMSRSKTNVPPSLQRILNGESFFTFQCNMM